MKVFPIIIYHGIMGKYISQDCWHIKKQPLTYNSKKSWMKNHHPGYNQLIEIKIKNITENKMMMMLKVHICVWRRRRDATNPHCNFPTPLFFFFRIFLWVFQSPPNFMVWAESCHCWKKLSFLNFQDRHSISRTVICDKYNCIY